MFYVYADVDLNNNQVFYYGSGTINRVIDEKRNKLHQEKICKLQNNWRRFIVYSSLDRKECYDIEKILIALCFDENKVRHKKSYSNRILNQIVDSNNTIEVEECLSITKCPPKIYLIGNQPFKIKNDKIYFILEDLSNKLKYITRKPRYISDFIRVSNRDVYDFLQEFQNPKIKTGIYVNYNKINYLIYSI